MNIPRVFSIFCTALLCILMVTPAQATTVSECEVLIGVIETELVDVGIGGRNSDQTRAGLESKLSGAKIKLDQTKFCDAIKKLAQFGDKALDLAVPNKKGETKMKPGDAASLAEAADEAIVCITELNAFSSCP